MRIDNEYIKNHPAEKPPTGEFAATPYDDYDELRNALIDIIPEFTMKLKVDPRNDRLEFSTDINSVFDIAWLTLARMLSEDPAPEDKGNSTNGIPIYYDCNSNTNDMDSFIVSFSKIYVDYRQKKTDSTRRISDELY